MAMRIDDLYGMARDTQGFTGVGAETFATRAFDLRTQGFLDFEILYLAQHDINSEGMSYMRTERANQFASYAGEFYADYPEATPTDLERDFSDIVAGWYFTNGWTFLSNGEPNPFAMLEQYTYPQGPAYETPQKKRSRSTESYEEITGRRR